MYIRADIRASNRVNRASNRVSSRVNNMVYSCRKTPLWKRLLALWLVACLTLFSVPFTGVYADEPQLPANLLNNWDFEDPLGPPNANGMPSIP